MFFYLYFRYIFTIFCLNLDKFDLFLRNTTGWKQICSIKNLSPNWASSDTIRHTNCFVKMNSHSETVHISLAQSRLFSV